MTVRELLDALKDANPKAKVCFEDNGTRSDIMEVLLSSKVVVLTEWEEEEPEP